MNKKYLFLIFLCSIPFTAILAEESHIVVDTTQNGNKNLLKIFSEDRQGFVEVETINELEYIVDRNGNVYLNVTVNNFLKLDEESKECEINKCEILNGIYETLKKFKNNNNDNTVIIEVTGILISSSMVIIGIFVARYITEHNRIKTKIEEIHKIQLYINSDFATIKRVATERKTKLEKYQNKINETDLTKVFAEELIKMQSIDMEKQLDDIKNFMNANTEYKKFILAARMGLKFTFWDMLEKVGSVLKLKEDEVKIIESTHYLINDYIKKDKTNWAQFVNEMLEIGAKTDREKLEEVIKLKSTLQIQETITAIEIIQEHLKYMETIEWVDLSKEILTPKIAEIINAEERK